MLLRCSVICREGTTHSSTAPGSYTILICHCELRRFFVVVDSCHCFSWLSAATPSPASETNSAVVTFYGWLAAFYRLLLASGRVGRSPQLFIRGRIPQTDKTPHGQNTPLFALSLHVAHRLWRSTAPNMRFNVVLRFDCEWIAVRRPFDCTVVIILVFTVEQTLLVRSNTETVGPTRMVKSYTSHRIQCFTWKIPVKTGVRRIILKSAGLCPEGLKRGLRLRVYVPHLASTYPLSPSPDRRVTPVDHCLGCCECVDTPRPLTLLRVTTHPASALSHTCKKNVTYRVPQ